MSSGEVGRLVRQIPTQYPFVLVDRILEHDPAGRLVAAKNVTGAEDFFAGHFPSQPVMPGVLILESLAQAAGIWLLKAAPDPRRVEVRVAGSTTPSSAARSSLGTSCASRCGSCTAAATSCASRARCGWGSRAPRRRGCCCRRPCCPSPRWTLWPGWPRARSSSRARAWARSAWSVPRCASAGARPSTPTSSWVYTGGGHRTISFDIKLHEIGAGQ